MDSSSAVLLPLDHWGGTERTMRAVPAGSVCRGRFFTETSAIVVLAEVALVKAGKSSAKSSSGLQKGKLQFSTPNLHSECRKKATKVRNE